MSNIPPPSTPAPRSGPPRVLFLDDDERILKSMKALFRSRYEVLTATEGAQALELLKKGFVHVVVSDQRMPTMTGVDFLRKSREISPGTMRILLTGYSDLASIVGSINQGEVFRFVHKPWNVEDITHTVAEAVEIATAAPRGVPAVKASDDRIPHMQEAVMVISPYKPLYENVRILIGQSCEVVRVKSVQEALQILSTRDVRVIVGEGGNEVQELGFFFSLLKRRYPHIVSVLVSTSADAETAVQLINQAQLFRLVVPPVTPDVLKSALSGAMRHALTLKIAPHLLIRHKVVEPPPSQATGKMSWLVEALRALPARLGLGSSRTGTPVA